MKSKKLVVTVIDIKTEVPSNFKINDVIAELDSEEIKINPVVFGKGANATVKFSGDNMYIADSQFRIEYERPYYNLIDIGTDYPTLIRLE
mmetsp:Transcript_13973/g.13580  ORF Transcript_13973/g.13580 Transcript_13973/m.13580 type:complete len:90 (-) Transcript_13973:61-330(-)|eukprot:CAMPEP_0170568310 /NCGR_PEP_ID=MMETSP0211-20121228/81096_1 /TAXON_ID=311385 /ORGANISM="Pseudokeronopsis sp., Strain OXSARD2" /LENGTH=89 /DNA_ID=CAMNT_0010890127 /DNA_START=696 /DNA_END=965 /DNA_ORIENTATION=+